jgi:hypothetical protein
MDELLVHATSGKPLEKMRASTIDTPRIIPGGLVSG